VGIIVDFDGTSEIRKVYDQKRMQLNARLAALAARR